MGNTSSMPHSGFSCQRHICTTLARNLGRGANKVKTEKWKLKSKVCFAYKVKTENWKVRYASHKLYKYASQTPHFSVFTFHLSVYQICVADTTLFSFQFSLFSLICVADTTLFRFHLSLFSLICVADTTLFTFPFSPFSFFFYICKVMRKTTNKL